jgi:hypothetical protein
MLQSLENKLCNFETELKSMSIKVSVYEDNLALRETLAEIIRSTEDFELAG